MTLHEAKVMIVEPIIGASIGAIELIDIKNAINDVNSFPLKRSQAIDLVRTIPPEADIP